MRISHSIVFLAGVSVAALRPDGSALTEVVPSAASGPAVESVETMLRGFVEDYRMDATAAPVTFGIEVRDADPSRWHVVVGERAAGASETPVRLMEGFPELPAPYFTTDTPTLKRIFRAELASLTAMGKAFSTDFAPLDLEIMPGFQPDQEAMEHLIKLSFHFWTRGFPERVRFGAPENNRPLHGGNGTLFYYQKGFRSGFFQIAPGDHVNADELSQTNPFPMLLIVTRGTLEARIGDQECELHGGEAIYVGPEVHHEFWIDEAAAGGAEGVLVMFGEGA